MRMNYRTVAGGGEAELVIEKSQFIGYAAPADTEEAALEFIQTIRKKHRDATHNVPAYVLGENNVIQRFSDDGEPSGTAGVPMLEVLKKEDVRDVVLVVTRYFGGIKLGTGGLVRAYTKAAKLALDAAGIVTRQLHQVVRVEIDYTLLGLLQNQLRALEYALKDTLYTEVVTLLVWVPAEAVTDFCAQCIEWTSGRCAVEPQELAYLEKSAQGRTDC